MSLRYWNQKILTFWNQFEVFFYWIEWKLNFKTIKLFSIHKNFNLFQRKNLLKTQTYKIRKWSNCINNCFQYKIQIKIVWNCKWKLSRNSWFCFIYPQIFNRITNSQHFCYFCVRSKIINYLIELYCSMLCILYSQLQNCGSKNNINIRNATEIISWYTVYIIYYQSRADYQGFIVIYWCSSSALINYLSLNRGQWTIHMFN